MRDIIIIASMILCHKSVIIRYQYYNYDNGHLTLMSKGVEQDLIKILWALGCHKTHLFSDYFRFSRIAKLGPRPASMSDCQ